MNKFLRLIFAIPVALALAACSSNPSTKNGGDPELESNARAALQRLFAEEPQARDVVAPMAQAVVVFPSVFKAGLIAGGQQGDGVMFDRQGKVLGYYRTGALSFGMQAGAQAFSEAIFLMNDTAIHELTSGAGLSLGVGPSFVLVDTGMAKPMTTTTLKADVYAFIFGQEGLMAGVGVQGQRISKYD